MRRDSSTAWYLSFFLLIVFLADTYGIVQEVWGFSFPFSHNGLAHVSWGLFSIQAILLLFVNLLISKLRLIRLKERYFLRMPKEGRKYWNKDAVRRALFQKNFRKILQPTAICFNSFVILLNYIVIRYPAETLSARFFNRWSLFMSLIALIFIIQLLKEIRPPMRATGIRFT